LIPAADEEGDSGSEDNPDVPVVCHIAFDKQKDITAWNTGVGPFGWRWGELGTADLRVR
jgi:hypothetical protein